MGIAAHFTAVIVNTAIFHPSGYQSAQLSDTEVCWPKDCLLAFGILQRQFLIKCTTWIFCAHQTISYWTVKAFPKSWVTASAREAICWCLEQQKFIKTENQLWWWGYVCGLGVVCYLEKQKWNLCGVLQPLLTFHLNGWLLMALLLDKYCAHRISLRVTVTGLIINLLIITYPQYE